MRKLHSGMEAWRYIVRSGSKQKAIEHNLPMMLSAAGVLGVLPFAILRYLQGNWAAAIIDTVVVAGFLILGLYVNRTQRVRAASIAFAALAIGGVIATVYVIGPHQIYWAFPALVGVFYLIRPGEAIVCALATLVALMPALERSVDSHNLTTIIVTIVVTSVIAFTFAAITNPENASTTLAPATVAALMENSHTLCVRSIAPEHPRVSCYWISITLRRSMTYTVTP